MFVIHGIESISTGETLIENIYYSMYVKWILFADLIWIIAGVCIYFTTKKLQNELRLTLLAIQGY